jgi:peptide deformylase
MYPMAILPILTYPHPLLAQKAKLVPVVDDAIRRLVDDLAETMYAAPGVGLAAPQVGQLYRIVVLDVDYTDEAKKSNLRVLINPEILTRDGSITWDEGCLSVPGITEEVKRAGKVLVRALDRQGKVQEIEGTGLLAVCMQHEIDHLEGTLFIDHLSRLKRKLSMRNLKEPDYPFESAPNPKTSRL